MGKINLAKESALTGGFMRGSYPHDMLDLRSEVGSLLMEKGFINEMLPLENLHTKLKDSHMVVDENDLNEVSTKFYETSDKFTQIYHEIIKYMSDSFFDFDFIFQTVPTIRFHFPVRFSDTFRSKDGLLLNYHTDTLLGHPLEEINCWLPLTRCSGSNALQLSSLDDGARALSDFSESIDHDADTFLTTGRKLFYEKMYADETYLKFVANSCVPVPMDYGEVIFFDPRCVHGTAENSESETRVSLDFRLIPLDAYDKLDRVYKSQGRSGRTFTRGDVYSSKSAREL